MQKRSSIGAKYKSYYNEIFNRVGGKRSSFLPTFVFRPLTPPYVRFRIRRFLFWVQSDIVVHQTRIACDAEFIVGRSVVHYTFRICPISLAAVAIDSCPIWLDATSYEILHPCLRSLPTFPYAHTYPSAKPLVNAHQRCFRICIFEV